MKNKFFLLAGLVVISSTVNSVRNSINESDIKKIEKNIKKINILNPNFDNEQKTIFWSKVLKKHSGSLLIVNYSVFGTTTWQSFDEAKDVKHFQNMYKYVKVDFMNFYCLENPQSYNLEINKK